MDRKLKIISYNCQSFSCNAPFISSLLDQCDILLLQETLVNEANSNILENINNDFSSAFMPSTRNLSSFSGRSSGGLVAYWKNFQNIKVHPIFINKRILGLKLSYGTTNLIILNVYLNCDYGTLDSLIEYKTNLAELSNFLNGEDYDEVLIVGDMNCDPQKGRFFREMNDFVISHQLLISDVDQLPLTSYTYISQNSRASTSWLDHIIASNSRLVGDVSIHYGSVLDDHIPISFNLEIFEPVLLPYTFQYEANINIKNVDWDRVSIDHFEEYHDILENISLDIWNEVLACDVSNCRSITHKEALVNLYEGMVDAVILSSSQFPLKNYCSKIKIVPGWNQYCKEFHAVAREAYMVWHNAGRIRSGFIFENMKSTRREFKRALKFCRINKLQIQKDILLSKFKMRNKNSFWTEVRRVQGHGSVFPSCIDNASNPRDVVKVFDEKFSQVLDDPRSQTMPNHPLRIDDNEDSSSTCFTISN